MQDPEIQPDIIESALARLEQVAGVTPKSQNGKWRVDRIERRRSTVFHLTGRRMGVTLYYKVFDDVPHLGSYAADSLRNRIARTQALSDRLIVRTSGTGIVPARVLAADPERRTVVTLGVEGREMRRLSPQPLLSGKRMSSHHARLVGKACAYIETCSTSEHVSFDWKRFTRQVDRRLSTSEMEEPVAKRLRALLMDGASHLLAEQGSIYVHGDLSPTNLLLSDKQVSLIDFSWFTGFRGLDLGLFSYRLHSMDRLLMGRGPALRRAMMNGYEDAVGGSDNLSSLNFVNLLLLVRGLGSRSSKTRHIARSLLETDISLPPPEDTGPVWWWDKAKAH